MSDFKDRLIAERKELSDKCTKLGAFITSEKFNDVNIAQQTLLKAQDKVMVDYMYILDARIALL